MTETQASFDVDGIGWADARCFIRHQEHGWPFRSMEWWVIIEMPGKAPGQTPWENGISIPLWLPRFAPYNTQYSGNVGLHPDMPGFAINAVFYGLVLWIAISCARRTRMALRLRRGRCPRCAYPIGTSPNCTECGHALPRMPVQPGTT